MIQSCYKLLTRIYVTFTSKMTLVSSSVTTSRRRNSSSSEVMASMTASRGAATFIDKIERYELQETLAYTSSDWLLSTEGTRMSVEPPRTAKSRIFN